MDTSAIAATFDTTVDNALFWVTDNGAFLFEWLRASFEGFYLGILWLLDIDPWYVVAVVFGLIAWRLVSLGFGIATALGLVICWLMGLWADTTSTFALVIAATFIALLFAIPVGVLTGYISGLDNVIEPILDLIQTMPPYIYLLPAIALLGFGPATALAATLIVAIPPAIRLTSLGYKHVPHDLLELGQAVGAPPWAILTKIETPAAMPTLVVGLNQCILLSLAMVVLAGLVGAGGLRAEVTRGLTRMETGLGLRAGLAIVAVAILLDRLSRAALQREHRRATG